MAGGLNSFFFAVGLLIPFYFSSFVFTFRVFCPRGLSALRPSLVRPLASTCCGIRIYGSSGVGQSVCWHIIMLEQFHECFGRSNFLHPSHEAGLLPSPHLAGCPLRLHEGSRLSAVIGLCRSLWRPLAAAAEGANSSASESICLRREGHLAERAGSGVWVGTPDPVDLSSPRWAPPYSSRQRQLSRVVNRVGFRFGLIG